MSRHLTSEETDPFPVVAPRPSSRLRGRIMAAGYRYKLLDESNRELDAHGSGRCQPRGLSVSLFVVCLLFMALLILFLLVLMGDWGLALNQGNCPQPSGHAGCLSPGCIKTSSDILTKMDLEVDPCSDMYHYACGGWIKGTTIPPGQFKTNMFSQASEKNDLFLRKFLEGDSIEFKGHNLTVLSKLRMAYRSCMDKATVERLGFTKLVEVINMLGSWTIVHRVNNIDSWDGDNWLLQDRLATSHNLWGSGLFSYDYVVDAKNTSQRIITFSQSGLTLSYPKEYTDKDYLKFQDAYLDYVSQVAFLLGGDKDAARNKMKDVYNLEKRLAEIFIPREEMTTPLDIYNKMTLEKFQTMIGPWIDIKIYLQNTFNGRHFSDSENIIVSTPSYFMNLSRVLQDTNKEVLANYLVWNTIQGFMGYLPESFAIAAFPLSAVENGVSELPQRWKRCVSFSKSVLGFAASAVYVDAKFSTSDKTKILHTIESIREDFIANLASVQWLDDVTRSRLKAKAQAVVFNIGYPDWVIDPQQLEEYYDKLEIKEDGFFENGISTIKFLTDKTIAKYGLKPDKTEWTEYPITVNGFYSPTFNMVMMPAGILQSPFFSSYFPKPFLYSTIGMVVGHELTHAFDNSGRMYDKDGNLGNQQWTPEVTRMYRTHAGCMQKQYSEFSLQGVHMNGKTTLNENIADNGALQLALRAFQKDQDTEPWTLPGLNLTQHQMFFLGYAQIMCAIYTPQFEIKAITTDEHSYPAFRVKGTYSNMPEFSEAFNCPKSDEKSSKQEICRVW